MCVREREKAPSSVCLSVCMFVLVYVCVTVTCVSALNCAHVCVCVCACVYVCVYVSALVSVWMCLSMFVHIYMCVCMCVCFYECTGMRGTKVKVFTVCRCTYFWCTCCPLKCKISVFWGIRMIVLFLIILSECFVLYIISAKKHRLFQTFFLKSQVTVEKVKTHRSRNQKNLQSSFFFPFCFKGRHSSD